MFADLSRQGVPDLGRVEARALTGGVESEIVADMRRSRKTSMSASSDRCSRPTYQLRYSPDGLPAGAFEIYRPFGPVAAATAHDARRVDLELGLGLLVLWAALFKSVATTSKRLRRQVKVNIHQASHDELTGLPNRTAFNAAVAEAVATAHRTGDRCAVLVADLDQFKDVNDTLGHPHRRPASRRGRGRRFAEALGPHRTRGPPRRRRVRGSPLQGGERGVGRRPRPSVYSSRCVIRSPSTGSPSSAPREHRPGGVSRPHGRARQGLLQRAEHRDVRG